MSVNPDPAKSSPLLISGFTLRCLFIYPGRTSRLQLGCLVSLFIPAEDNFLEKKRERKKLMIIENTFFALIPSSTSFWALVSKRHLRCKVNEYSYFTFQKLFSNSSKWPIIKDRLNKYCIYYFTQFYFWENLTITSVPPWTALIFPVILTSSSTFGNKNIFEFDPKILIRKMDTNIFKPRNLWSFFS